VKGGGTGKAAGDRRPVLVLGLGLWALALFVALSLVPVEVLGPGASRLFPGGNLAGAAGAWVSTALTAGLGVAAAVVPFLVGVWAVVCVGWGTPRDGARWSAVFLTVAACVPPLLHTALAPFGRSAPWAEGLWGIWAGAWLVRTTGWLAGSLLLLFGLAAALVAAQGTAPFRAAAAAARAAAAAAARTARRLAALVPRIRRPRTTPDLWADREPAVSGNGAPGVEAGRAERGSATPGDGPASKPAHRRGASDSATLSLFDDDRAARDDALPPLDLLSPAPRGAVDFERELDALGDVLIEKLRTFKVEGRIVGRTTGPVVTQFEVEPASGVKVGRIAALADDLALALRAPSVRIVAPIPGKGAVGVEVPNPEPRIVALRSILESPAYQRSRAELPLALGEDLAGRPYVADLARMPHLLIAGATGSGKSVCVNALITSLLYRHPPSRLRFLMIDPKMVELGVYNDLPHLRHPVVTQTPDAAAVLKWLVWEMERRYEWFSANGVRSLRDFNRRVREGRPIRAPVSEGDGPVEAPETMPYVVLVIDELADLILTAASEVERPLALLAQKARATGIHLVVATQRPSVNVITGLIKANFPCRIAFRVSSKVDSRTILDQNGAETLLGNGDMLFLPPGQSEPVRIQGALCSTDDTERILEWFRNRARAPEPADRGEEDILEMVRAREAEEALEDGEAALPEERDPLFRQAAEIVVQHDHGSTSLLQRRLKIGYGRAARIIDQLHAAGILGPPEGSKPREVLVTVEELDRICSADPSRRRA
jgi:S-DNA-T family DNA segregation ATPase FtsK/SpoIIIE